MVGFRHQAGLATVFLDQVDAAVHVDRGFRMKGDHAGAGAGKLFDQFIDRLHHQVNVDGRGNTVLAKALQIIGPNVRLGTKWLSITSK